MAVLWLMYIASLCWIWSQTEMLIGHSDCYFRVWPQAFKDTVKLACEKERNRNIVREKESEREAVVSFDCLCVCGRSTSAWFLWPRQKKNCKNVNFSPFSAFLWTSSTFVITNDEADYCTHAHCLSEAAVSVLSVDAGCQHTHSPGCIRFVHLPCGLFPLSVVGTLQQKPLGYISL